MRLLASEPLPSALPEVRWLCEPGPVRPGELHEPIVLGHAAERHLERVAARGGLSASLAARLLLEAALLRSDLGLASAVPVAGLLDEAARSARVSRRLSSGEADYLRALAVGRRPEQGGAVTVPVRLLARLDELDLEGALDGDVLQAVSWEAAAVIEGRTMLEWGLLTVLRGTG